MNDLNCHYSGLPSVKSYDMKQQTAVEWFFEQYQAVDLGDNIDRLKIEELIQQAKVMEKEQRIKDYNAGYDDAQCNHINDAENYANEIEYIQSRIDELDNEIKAKQNNIANMLINGDTNNK